MENLIITNYSASSLVTNSASSKDWLGHRDDLKISSYDLGPAQQYAVLSGYQNLPESVTPVIYDPKPSHQFFGSHVAEAVEIVKDWIK